VRFEFKPSFIRLLEKLEPGEREQRVVAATRAFMVSLEERIPLAPGLGMKRLKGSYWEIRAGLGNRVVFHWEKDVVEFVLVGNHEDVRRFLRTA
jgi:hypothetical protein